MRRAGRIYEDDGGFTTTSMVLALLITLSLLFTAAQVYRIQSASAEVQDIADAAALSAQNQVAEFMIAARYCDAIVLSMSLTGLAVTGLGIVALCTPATATLSEGLVKAGRQVISARNAFSKRATKALDKIQAALPYFSAACAASTAQANNGDSSGANYLGIAMLVPFEGEKIEASKADKAEEALDDVEEQADEVREDAERAEEASQKANRLKEEAFMHDCGANPDYCMYERAARLAGLSGGDNPLYQSADTWTFGVALGRAQRYYLAREALEAPAGSSVRDQARSALRKRFYRYAAQLLQDGFVHESEEAFDAYFPLLPANIDELRSTELYTEHVYPITVDTSETEITTETLVEIDGEQFVETTTEVQTEQHYIMHAWSGCPNADSPASLGSVKMLEAGGFEMCPLCEFTVQSMGNVASASTSISNGFEHHYRAVARAAEEYKQAFEEAQKPKEEVKDTVSDLLQELVDAAKEGLEMRIAPKPPGRLGAIALVVNAGTTSPAGSFASGFVQSAGSLGPRAAVAAATLVDEGSDEGRTVLNSALDGLRDGGGVAVGAAGMVLDAWSWLVSAYGDGQSSLTGAIEEGLNGMPLVGASGLGTWAADKLANAVKTVGLEPAEVGALKPLLVNTAHVASAGDGQAARFLAVKQRVIAHPAMSTDLFASVLTEAERLAIEQVEGIGPTLQIASIELLGDGGPSIPVTIPIPESVTNWGVASIQGLFGRIKSYYVTVTGARIWE